MAIGADTVWELNSGATASNVNAGGFNTGNANFLTNLTTTAGTGNTSSPVVLSASYNFVAGDVGAWVYIKSGTNWTPGWYQIASVAANQATLSAAIGQAIQRNSALGYPTPKYATNTVAGVATVGTPTSGTFGIDYSQGTASIINNTDLASTDGTTNPSTVTSAGSPFGLNHVGNLIHVNSGTNWTAGWYEIVSVSVVTATLDRAVGTVAVLTAGTFRVGGAMSLNSTLDDDLFENGTPGNCFFVKGNTTFTIGEVIGIAADGTSTNPITIQGYASTRGDLPTGSTRPIFAMAGNSIGMGAYWDIFSLVFSLTNANGLTTGIGNKIVNCKLTNSSTTAGRTGLNFAANTYCISSEAISYRGTAIAASAAGEVLNSYVHDSDIGIRNSSTAATVVIGSIIESCVTNAFNFPSAAGNISIQNNTIFGSINKTGVGINFGSTVTVAIVRNNIITGFVTGITHATAQTEGFGSHNAFFNNTTDVTNWIKNTNDVTGTDPQFTSVAQLTGTTATTSGSVLTQSGGDFSTVIDNRDFLYLVSGTGITAGQYLITAHTATTVTLDIAPGTNATADKVWQITTGRNFAIGTNLKALGTPGVFPAGLTTGFMDIGAVQRQELPGGSFTFVGI